MKQHTAGKTGSRSELPGAVPAGHCARKQQPEAVFPVLTPVPTFFQHVSMLGFYR